jgi:hypothetical protein
MGGESCLGIPQSDTSRHRDIGRTELSAHSLAGIVFLLFVIEKLLTDFSKKGLDDAFLATVGIKED